MNSTPPKRVRIALPAKTLVDISQLPEIGGGSGLEVLRSAQKERKKEYGSLTSGSKTPPPHTPSHDRYINLASMTLRTTPQEPKSTPRIRQSDISPSRSPTGRTPSHSMPRFSPKKMGPPLRVLSSEQSIGRKGSGVFRGNRDASNPSRTISGTPVRLPTKPVPFLFAREQKTHIHEAEDVVSERNIATPKTTHEEKQIPLSTRSPQAMNRQSNGNLKLKREPMGL